MTNVISGSGMTGYGVSHIGDETRIPLKISDQEYTNQTLNCQSTQSVDKTRTHTYAFCETTGGRMNKEQYRGRIRIHQGDDLTEERAFQIEPLGDDRYRYTIDQVGEGEFDTPLSDKYEFHDAPFAQSSGQFRANGVVNGMGSSEVSGTITIERNGNVFATGDFYARKSSH